MRSEHPTRLADRVAVVTGGASGIGLATVERFLQEGAEVVFGDMNGEHGKRELHRLEQAGHSGRLKFAQVDVSLEEDVIGLIGLAEQEFGHVDIMFNNAGIGGSIGPIVDTAVEHWDRTFEVNCRSVFLGTKHAAKVMKKYGNGGSIINTASTAAISGGTGPLAYSATKAAVVNFTKNAACELAQYSIRVNCVCPGIIFTPLGHGGLQEETEAVAKLIQPLPSRGEPAHVASAVTYLASSDSEFVTGEAHAVDGGYLANGLIAVHPLPGGEQRHKYSGMTYGSTGQEASVRTLDNRQESQRNE